MPAPDGPDGHLATVLPHVRHVVMLDTHIALEGTGTQTESDGFEYRYINYKEAGRTPPLVVIHSLMAVATLLPSRG